MRRLGLATLFLGAALAVAGIVPPVAAAGITDQFRAWLEQDLWPEAKANGVSKATFDAAFSGVTPNLKLPDLVLPGQKPETPKKQHQAEFGSPGNYFAEKTIGAVTSGGRARAARYGKALAAIEQRYGVPGGVVLAIWGRESGFGAAKIPYDAFEVLGTKAFLATRKEMFRTEVIGALVMLEKGLARKDAMKSSWAGALGQPQFLPTSFLKHAVDFDGDGRPDIFKSVPDALASAAKQLAGKGWQRGLRWAYEVKAPARFDCTQAVPEVRYPIHVWIKSGFAPVSAQKLSNAEVSETASLLQPEGSLGPSFLTTKNYFVIKDYNFSDLYVLFVGNLSDRIAGGGAFVQSWGKSEQMRTAQVEEMQRIMTARGLYKDKIDGKAGMLTRAALGAYQKANGLKVDCWPHAAVLEHMQRRLNAR